MTTTMQRGKCNVPECCCCIFEAKENSPKECECGHKRNFHLVPSTEQTRRSLPGAKSVSEMVAPVFEKEVNLHLNQNLPSCLSRCRISDIRNWQIEDERETLLEMDSFGYIYEDECDYAQGLATSGLFLIEPEGCGRKKSAESKQKLSKSPGAIARKLDTLAEKYIVGESYSGQSENTIRGKVETLEDRVKKLQIRYNENHAEKAEDVTCAVGAVMLCFSAGPKQREQAKSHFDKIVCESMSAQATPLLWRIAQARRLFLVVLSDTENPQATALRELAAQSQSTQLQLDEMGMNMNSMRNDMNSMRNDMNSGFASLKKILSKDRKKDNKSTIACRHGEDCTKFKEGKCRFSHPSE